MAQAFVSYVRENSRLVDRLVNDLRRGGVNVWLDRDSITPGVSWERAIQDGILAGGFFLACFSREYHARADTYMNQELRVAYQIAARKGFESPWLIPVLLNACELPPQRITAEHTLRSLQCVNLADDWHEGMRQLLNLLEPSRSFGQLRRPSREPPRLSRSGAPAPLLALDFGTSFSSMAIFTEERGWQAIPDEAGRTLVPSVVTFAENWDYFIGWDAVAAAVHSPGRSVANIKRWLGRDGDIAVEHKRFDPETLASLVIRYMKENAEQHLGAAISKTIVAAPANFCDAQSAALARACTRAGLQVQRLVSEPNAAGLLALEWWQQRRSADAAVPPLALVLVIDMGGGTTDVSLIQVADDDDLVEVLLVAGDNELGGMDYDEAVFRFLKAREIDPRIAAGMPWTPLDDRRLRMEASRAKVQLSFAPSVTLVAGEIEQKAGLQLLQCELTRDDLRSATAALDARLEALIGQVLALASKNKLLKSAAELDAVFLAGQGSKIYTVAELLKRTLPAKTLVTDYQEQAVVRGLGVYSGVLGGVNKNVLMLDVLHRPILMRCMDAHPDDGGFDALVSTDQEVNVLVLELLHAHYPVPMERAFRVRFEGAGPVVLEFLEGDAVGGHSPLASVTVQLAPGNAEAKLVVTADVNKTVRVLATEPSGRVLVDRQITNCFLEPSVCGDGGAKRAPT